MSAVPGSTYSSDIVKIKKNYKLRDLIGRPVFQSLEQLIVHTMLPDPLSTCARIGVRAARLLDLELVSEEIVGLNLVNV